MCASKDNQKYLLFPLILFKITGQTFKPYFNIVWLYFSTLMVNLQKSMVKCNTLTTSKSVHTEKKLTYELQAKVHVSLGG